MVSKRWTDGGFRAPGRRIEESLTRMRYASTFEQHVFGGSSRLRQMPVGQRQVLFLSPDEEEQQADWLEGKPRLVVRYQATRRRCIVSLSATVAPCERDILQFPATPQEMVDAQAHRTLRALCEQHYGSSATVHLLPDVHLYCTRSRLRHYASPNIRPVTRRNVDLVIDSLNPQFREFCEDAAGYILDNGPAFAWFDGDRPVGLASVHPSHMSDRVGNIGNVTVEEGHRRRGIGRAVVSAVAGALLEQGRLPVYGCSVDNLASVGTALSAGFKLAECNYRVYVSEACSPLNSAQG